MRPGTPEGLGSASGAPTPFEIADAFVFGQEQGHNDGAHDRGGDTWDGISRRAYPNEEPWPPPPARRKELRRRDYWDAIHLDALPPKIALVVYDCAINQGAETAVRILQEELGVPVDGILGPATAHAAYRADSRALLKALIAHRAVRYAYNGGAFNPDFPRWGRTWNNRLVDVLLAAVLYGA